MLKRWIILFVILCGCVTASVAQERKFDVLVLPSLMDTDLDGWYRIPHNSGPYLHNTQQVVKNQLFNLIIIFSGYAVDHSNLVNLTYDVQIYDPFGKPTEDAGRGIVGYQGEVGNAENLLLNQQLMRVMFTDDYAYGTYQIEVKAYDQVSGTSVSVTRPIELLPIDLDFSFADSAAANTWMMSYHRELEPLKAVAALQLIVQTDPKWVTKHLSLVVFFSRLFADNLHLLNQVNQDFERYSLEEQKRFLLIDYFVGENQLATHWQTRAFAEFRQTLQGIVFPSLNGEINHAVQLDMLWSEFLATGKYEPIRKIVSALNLVKYQGTIDDIKQNKPQMTEELKRQAYLEATYKSAVWSLLSNNKQFPLVNKYCHFIYQNEQLTDSEKQQLAIILRKVQLDAKS